MLPQLRPDHPAVVGVGEPVCVYVCMRVCVCVCVCVCVSLYVYKVCVYSEHTLSQKWPLTQSLQKTGGLYETTGMDISINFVLT